MASPIPNPRPESDNSPIQGRTWLTAKLEQWITALTPSCTQAIRLISDSLDRPMGFRTRFSLSAHYLVCCYCRRYEQQMHRLRRMVVRLPDHLDEVMTDRLDDELKDRIKARLREGR
jgi:hypothetical protein